MIRLARKRNWFPDAASGSTTARLSGLHVQIVDNDADIVEMIAMSGLAVYANIMADATGMEPDAMFAEVAGNAAAS